MNEVCSLVCEILASLWKERVSEFSLMFFLGGGMGIVGDFKRGEKLQKNGIRNTDAKQTHSIALAQLRNSFVFILFFFFFLFLPSPPPPTVKLVARSTTNTEKRATVEDRVGKVAKKKT